jgi:23S rRNA pseudouridine1911/1915/1917 synthase
MSRHALHAIRAQFLHPTTLKTIALEAPLPADFEAALTTLRAF